MPEQRVVHRVSGLLRVEDWALAAWMLLGYPLLSRLQGSGGPFDPGRPLDGVFGIVACAGALACIATRSAGAADDRGALAANGAVLGPLVGGLGLVGASAFAGLGWEPVGAIGLAFVLAAVLPAFRGRLPAFSLVTRRLLVTPYVLASGAIFWSFVRVVAGAANVSGSLGSSIAADVQAIGLATGFLALFSATFYAMLVYAPRQVAEREGGLVTWLVRYGVFLASVVLGLGAWTSFLGLG